MKTEVNPKDTARAEAFEMWMTSPMPMVTLTRTFDVSNLLKAGRKSGMKFNALLCWCIGRAVAQVKEFYLLPVSSCPDGRRARCHVSGAAAEGDKQILKMIKPVSEFK